MDKPTTAEIRKWLETHDYTFGTRAEIALLLCDRLEAAAERERKELLHASANNILEMKDRLESAEQHLQRIKHTLDCYDERKGAVPLREFLQALLKEQIK